MSKYEEYVDLLSKTYDEAVDYLLQKYGPATADYFSEKSYQRFLNGEIKKITVGKYKRTSEGLYCHHIDEKTNLNISNQLFVKANNVSFEFQKKDRLVYCDLIEHTILHVLITKETSHEFGAPGYNVWLKPMIEEWYLEKIMPKPPWMKKSHHRAFLTPEEAVHIIRKMEESIGRNYHNTPFDYHEAKRKKVEEYEERMKAREIEAIESAKRYKERTKFLQQEKIEAYHRTHPLFKEIGIHPESPRQKVIGKLYELKYKDNYTSKKELERTMKPIVKNELLKELHAVLERR